jgi:hypothetical protein
VKRRGMPWSWVNQIYQMETDRSFITVHSRAATRSLRAILSDGSTHSFIPTNHAAIP